MRVTWSWCSFAILVALAVAPTAALGQYPMPGPGMYGPYPPSPMPGAYPAYPPPMTPGMAPVYYPPVAMAPYAMPMAPRMAPAYPAMPYAAPAPAYRMPATMPVSGSTAAQPGPAPFITGFVTGASPAPNCPQSQAPAPAAPTPAPAAPGAPEAPAKKDEQPQNAQAPYQLPSTLPSQDAFAQAPEAGTEAARSYEPNMIGDLIGYTGLRSISSTRFSSDAYLPLTQFGAFKISENESPRPQTRVFGTYSYFNNVNGSINDPAAPGVDVHRETTGFEYAFWGGYGSVGLRVPFIQTAGDRSIEDSEVGDLSIILKGVLCKDCKTQSLLSMGLVVTAPTGTAFRTVEGARVNPVLLQPWLGGIIDLNRVYIHGFTAGVAPTDTHIPVLVDTDIGIGFWLYRCNGKRFLTGIVPTVEGHANIPVSNRGIRNDPVGFPDEGVVTGGMHFLFCHHATLTLGASVPVTGPQPYDIEASAQFNYRF